VAKLSLDELHELADSMLADAPEGEPLTPLESSLIRLGLTASVTALDGDALGDVIESARTAGATAAQLQEIISLVSGLGVHSLMMAAVPIADAYATSSTPLTPEQQALWDKHVGTDPFWNAFEVELPRFLGAMLRLSSDQFVAFFDYCAVPWKSGQVRAKIKELAAMACDSTPAHRFGPGFRLHLGNAIKLGAGRLAVTETLRLAAAMPEHAGWR
jgi:alkylhydroperoxidase/carboxymuconolactone decarboxylase family protein YurZ